MGHISQSGASQRRMRHLCREPRKYICRAVKCILICASEFSQYEWVFSIDGLLFGLLCEAWIFWYIDWRMFLWGKYRLWFYNRVVLCLFIARSASAARLQPAAASFWVRWFLMSVIHQVQRSRLNPYLLYTSVTVNFFRYGTRLFLFWFDGCSKSQARFAWSARWWPRCSIHFLWHLSRLV